MKVFEEFKKNPMIPVSDALALLTQLSVANNALSYPETLNEAVRRTQKHIQSIMFSTNSITKEIYAVEEDGYENEILFEPDEEYIKRYGYSKSDSLVNVLELLSAYNNVLIVNGKQPLSETMYQKTNGDTVNLRDLGELTKAIADIVMNIVDREDKIKVETLDAIFNEATNGIKDEAIRSRLPELKSLLREQLDDQITKGRISNVTDKKILAGIHLAEKYKGNKAPNCPQLVGDINGFMLKKPDKEHVAKIYFKHRSE